MKKIKISQLPLAATLRGLFTIGTDAENKSVKVSLEFVEDAADNANTKAGVAQTAADNANAATTAANNAKTACETATGQANDAKTAANSAAELANTKAALANDKAELADSKATLANTKAGLADDAATLANTKAGLADTAAERANTAAAAAEALLTNLIPSGLTVKAPSHITRGNLAELFVRAVLAPTGVRQNIIFIGDNRSVAVAPDGRLTVLGVGVTTIHVVPTLNTALAKSITVTVTEPALRLASATALRFTSSGAMRLL